LRLENNFSVRSVYKFMADGPLIVSSLVSIWKLKAPRMQIFTWLMLKNFILTTDNLKKRGWQLPSFCYMCARAEETVQHLFTECETIQNIISYMNDVIFMHMNHSNSYKNSEIKMILDHTGDLYWRRLQFFTCFIVWREMRQDF
jgi:zinc-binding in reverse transcriptase